jgi:hypothetical protein
MPANAHDAARDDERARGIGERVGDIGHEREQQQRDRLRKHERRHRDVAKRGAQRHADDEPDLLAAPPVPREIEVEQTQREKRRRRQDDHT